MKKIFILIVLIFFCFPSTFIFCEPTSAYVLHVPDGDTIHINKNFKKIKIRLYGIDCPEIKQPGGIYAKERAKELISNKKIIVENKGYDRYGRMVGRVFVEGDIDLGLKLVSEGFCRWYKKYAWHDLALKGAESDARAKKIGVWSRSDSIAPWKWRKLRRKN